MFWIVLRIGPESFLEAHPNASNFELKWNNSKIFPFLFLWVPIVKYICNQVLNVAIIFQITAFCHRGMFFGTWFGKSKDGR